MKTYHRRLVLGCVMLAIEVIRFANKLIALLNITCNYFHDPEVGVSV
jgi:hypothetical protein